jgi:adenylosuccinate synthase
MSLNKIDQDFDKTPNTRTSVEFTDSVKGRGPSNTEQHHPTTKEAKNLADKEMENGELLKSLNLLKSMEEMLSVYDNSDDPNISRVIEEYKNLKKKISEGLGDKTKEIFKQA